LEATSVIPSNKIILIGDFNARTGNMEDTLLPEKHDTELETTDFFSQIQTKRNNQDKTVNKYGRLLLEYCTATHSYIANGRTIGDFQGKYTCHEARGSSTVDYAIINETLQKCIKSFRVLPPSLSDHCPIKLEVSYRKNKTPRVKVKNTKLKPRIEWNEKTKEIFLKHIFFFFLIVIYILHFMIKSRNCRHYKI
jgi:endonuclease/exonuclease/phosphatase family metal-dependent hydrolase